MPKPVPSLCRLRALGLVCSLGAGLAVRSRLLEPGGAGDLSQREDLVRDRTIWAGTVHEALPPIEDPLARWSCRNNALALHAYRQIETAVQGTMATVGPDRFAVIVGTSTSGVLEAEEALAVLGQQGTLPGAFHYAQLEHGGLAAFLAAVTGARGPAYTISTACTASARALLSAKALLELGVIDAALVGGADALSRMTAEGFHALAALAQARSRPLSSDRDGLNLGEAAALFLVTREEGGVQLLGAGAATDAYHMSAPDPEGSAALTSMRVALEEACVTPSEIQTVNLHGTGTPHNDAMEARAVAELFGTSIPCSSTKPRTGHTLGTAGALEAAFLWLTLADGRPGAPLALIPHPTGFDRDPDLPPIRLAEPGEQAEPPPGGRRLALSASHAFGGNSCALVLGDGPSGPRISWTQRTRIEPHRSQRRSP